MLKQATDCRADLAGESGRHCSESIARSASRLAVFNVRSPADEARINWLIVA